MIPLAAAMLYKHVEKSIIRLCLVIIQQPYTSLNHSTMTTKMTFSFIKTRP
jgi:hypothetical protein